MFSMTLQMFEIPGFREIRNSWLPENEKSGIPGIRDSRNLKFRIVENPEFQTSGIPDVWDLRNLGFRNSWLPEFTQFPEFWKPGFSRSAEFRRSGHPDFLKSLFSMTDRLFVYVDFPFTSMVIWFAGSNDVQWFPCMAVFHVPASDLPGTASKDKKDWKMLILAN